VSNIRCNNAWLQVVDALSYGCGSIAYKASSGSHKMITQTSSAASHGGCRLHRDTTKSPKLAEKISGQA
jgi:hypothetical protein